MNETLNYIATAAQLLIPIFAALVAKIMNTFSNRLTKLEDAYEHKVDKDDHHRDLDSVREEMSNLRDDIRDLSKSIRELPDQLLNTLSRFGKL